MNYVLRELHVPAPHESETRNKHDHHNVPVIAVTSFTSCEVCSLLHKYHLLDADIITGCHLVDIHSG